MNLRLGDKVKYITDKLHIPQCDSCKKRQEYLNMLFQEGRLEEHIVYVENVDK